MPEFQLLGKTETHAVENRSVVHRIEQGHVTATEEAGKNADVDPIARRKNQRRLAMHELGKPLLEMDVDIESAIQQARAGASRAVFFRRAYRGLFDLGMAGETEVVHRPQHDDLLAGHRHHRILGRLDLSIEEVMPRRAGLAHPREFFAFLEDVHVDPPVVAGEGEAPPIFLVRGNSRLYP